MSSSSLSSRPPPRRIARRRFSNGPSIPCKAIRADTSETPPVAALAVAAEGDAAAGAWPSEKPLADRVERVLAGVLTPLGPTTFMRRCSASCPMHDGRR
ncbi:hypothetical protein BREVUG8_10253 [Brevundimonas sp. G8]|nr:hypothetical protein BREVUG8_10253 [Brevundimonas sp. G8]